MVQRYVITVFALFTLGLFTRPSPQVQRNTDEIHQRMLTSMLNSCDPYLLRQAEKVGLYSREEFPICRDINPYYIRGDFNGDREMDVAFWVKDKSNELQGIAILHGTLDTLYVFGAGKARPLSDKIRSNQVRVDGWHLLPQGYVTEHPYNNIPEIGVVEGKPFTFERETLEFIHFGKSAFVFYWAKGQYWEFWTAD